MQTIGTYILVLVLGGVIGWLIKPTEGTTVFNSNEYVEFTTDTINTVDTVFLESVKYVNIKPATIRDTIYIDTVDRTYIRDLVAEYECLRDKLIENGFERIKTFNQVTADGDSIYIELESVRDLVLKAELNLGAREVATQDLRTYYLPAGADSEAWYIKPAIAISGMAVGYVIRGNQ